ncbi:hypothetical protein CHS0354_009213, partial [Potamilus streckersoni]
MRKSRSILKSAVCINHCPGHQRFWSVETRGAKGLGAPKPFWTIIVIPGAITLSALR